MSLFKAYTEWFYSIHLPWSSIHNVLTQHTARVSHMIRMGLTTYPVGAVWYVHPSPDHSYGVLDSFKWGIRAGVGAIHPALHLDVNGLAFPILQKNQSMNQSAPHSVSTKRGSLWLLQVAKITSIYLSKSYSNDSVLYTVGTNKTKYPRNGTSITSSLRMILMSYLGPPNY